MEDPVQTPTDLDVLRRRVQHAIDGQIAGAAQSLAAIGDETAPLVSAVSGLLTGGKGLRAGFLYWGYRAAGGADSDALVRPARRRLAAPAARLGRRPRPVRGGHRDPGR